MADYNRTGNVIPIMGYNVHFPHDKKPFPAQLAIMSKTLQALRNSQNALIESPTGTGKTLALLCAALSWQTKHAEIIAEEDEESRLLELRRIQEAELARLRTQMQKAGGQLPKAKRINLQYEDEEDAIETESMLTPTKEKGKQNSSSQCSDFEDDFEDQATFHSADGKSKGTNVNESIDKENDASLGNIQQNRKSTKKTKLAPVDPMVGFNNEEILQQMAASIALEVFAARKLKKKKLPRIYFASRTHSQLQQVIRELKKLPNIYHMVKEDDQLTMTILGSRAHYCNHPKVSKSKNKEEDCKKLLDQNSCRYFKGIRGLRNSLPMLWDIEEVVEMGNVHKACPYFTSKMILGEAHIAFCPYNYLLDPGIRKAMEIDLTDAVVIFDEAHNMEDMARSSASWEIPVYVLQETATQLWAAISHQPLDDQTHYRSVLLVIQGLMTWLKEMEDKLTPQDYKFEHNVWEGKELLKVLAEHGKVTPELLPILRESFTHVAAFEAEKLGNNSDMSISTSALSTIDALSNTLGYIFDNDFLHLEDYRMVIQKVFMRHCPLFHFLPFIRPFAENREWDKASRSAKWTYKLCFWCLNPAVAFKQIEAISRSIVLTSGTLSPLESFASELGIDFKVRLETNHVIDTSRQVWVGAVASGPRGISLNASFKNQDGFEYQDSLAQTLIDYFGAIPGGVLVFFPSYHLLEKLKTRWQSTGAWDAMGAIKAMFCEPRETGSSFDEILADYRRVIQSSIARGKNSSSASTAVQAKKRRRKANENGGNITGAALLAVCRGKVSEGIDFADENARGVIAIGIPYPNVKDLHLVLKKRYQNAQCKKRPVLDGDTWYQHQTFRALNQAIGEEKLVALFRDLVAS